MPSPFPGMDPYLESVVLWGGVHLRFITYLSDKLNALMPPTYIANIGERVYVEPVDRNILPDVWLTKKRHTSGKRNGKALAALADDPWEFELVPEEIHEAYIEIQEVTGRKRIVTSIEVLSPTNKLAGGEGRGQYLQKQREVLTSKTHLLEMDLLRHGHHTVAVPAYRLQRRGLWDYLVCLSRGNDREHRQVWAFTLKQRLPRIRVPLAGKDPDVVVDLQRLLDEVYDQGAYARKIDYRYDPMEHLTPEQDKWADKLLKRRGLRR